MAKVRVYELAKEAGVDSKSMVAKLNDLGYSFKTYSSAVEKEDADEIRSRLGLGVTKIEEKRIQSKGKTTIIRRRKAVKVEPPPEPPAVAEEPAEEISSQVEEKSPVEDEVSIEETEASVLEKEQEPEVEIEPQPEIGEVVSESDIEPPPSPPEQLEAEEIEKKKEEEGQGPLAPEVSPDEDAPPQQEEPPVESEKKKQEAPPLKKPASRKGLARVIKRSAIVIPVEEEKPKPKPRPRPKPKPKRPEKPKAKGAFSGKAAPEKKTETPQEEAQAKGKKGKRFVKFHSETSERDRARRPAKRKGRTEIVIDDPDFDGRIGGSKFGRQRGGKRGKKVVKPQFVAETKAIKKRIKIFEFISVGDLAHRMGLKANEIIAKLMGMDVMATVNQALDVETASLVADEFGYEVEKGFTQEQGIVDLEIEEAEGGEEKPRPPVVTIMGHVDHGKTSILDAIRKTDVAASEAGGITQHIGAHHVRSSIGDVVFLDTPGHAAFTEMRSRGAKVTDVVVLVVAADDGVMEQTKEAINHAKAAEVPIVVAVNKIDKDGADPMRVMRELAEFGLVPEDWGGETIYCQTSAKQNKGIEELLEQILLQAEILELKANLDRRAKGWVIEAELHKGRGPVATVLVQQGTLRTGDYFVVGEFSGKVRSLTTDKGDNAPEAGPAVPVEVQGLSGVPLAGDEFIVVPDEKTAKNVSQERQIRKREFDLAKTTKISLDNLFEKLQEGDVKELRVLLRADVQGTVEAFGKAIEELSTDVIRVKILHGGTGTITESDVLLAAASDAVIIGFNVRPSTKVADMAKSEKVDIRFYDVIYHALDDIKKAMVGMLDPTYLERVIGMVEVRETYSVPKIGTIAGSYVTDGKIERNAQVRLLRDSVVVYTGNIASLRRFKDDAKEVQSGYECGVGLENYNDIKIGDMFEVFVMDEVAGKL